MTVDSEGGLYRQFGRQANRIWTTPTLVSGTAQLFYHDHDCIAFVNITGGSAGTVKVEVIDVLGTSHVIANSLAAGTGTDMLLTVPLAPAEQLKVTASVAAITATTVCTN